MRNQNLVNFFFAVWSGIESNGMASIKSPWKMYKFTELGCG